MGTTDFAGFGVRGYRSFGGDLLATFGPMRKVHLVVGQNNVGKSNALHFMGDVLAVLRAHGLEQIEPSLLYPAGDSDRPEGWPVDVPVVVTLGFSLTDDVKEALHFDDPKIRRWLTSEAYSRGHEGIIWLDFVASRSQQISTQVQMQLSLEQVSAAESEGEGFTSDQLSEISSTLTGGSGPTRHNLDLIQRAWNVWRFIPDVAWIDAVREITASGDENLRTGQGIIPRLAGLQHPPLATRDADLAQFNSLEAFVRDVLEDDQARIEIPNSRTTIHVHGRFGVRELGHLGTGINELVLIATVASINSGKMVCIEEPEIHLHPTLQRKLIEYLDLNTSNHYLISTHSAAMLNAEIASITHVEMPEKLSVANPVLDPAALARVASDLGNRASDIVQSNYIVWVEGPSDRLYVRHWLGLADPSLVEGAHYSIMFYGGALLSHLTADDNELDEFIQLLRINRHIAVVIDSDKRTAESVLNATKRRVIGELERIDAPAFVTDDYTIENYVPRATLQEAIDELYPGKGYVIPASRFKSPLGKKFDGTESYPSKTTVARYVTEQSTEWSDWPDGLRTNIETIAKQIRDVNGLPAAD